MKAKLCSALGCILQALYSWLSYPLGNDLLRGEVWLPITKIYTPGADVSPAGAPRLSISSMSSASMPRAAALTACDPCLGSSHRAFSPPFACFAALHLDARVVVACQTRRHDRTTARVTNRPTKCTAAAAAAARKTAVNVAVQS